MGSSDCKRNGANLLRNDARGASPNGNEHHQRLITKQPDSAAGFLLKRNRWNFSDRCIELTEKRSSSSGEIKDDSGDEFENEANIEQVEATSNGYVEYRRNEPEQGILVSRKFDRSQRFDPENDYRRPQLSPEQINLRVRKIPPPDVLVDLDDFELRRLLVDVHELDREQIRLFNNRRKLLEQMRQMHKQELNSLRECMETLRNLMVDRGMNLFATHIGQDVMEFLHEKGESLSSGPMQLSSNIPATSSESCPSSFGVFTTTSNSSPNSLPSKSLVASKHSTSSTSIPYAAIPTNLGPIAIPPPDFSVPPPLPVPPLHGIDQANENPGTSMNKTEDIPAQSSVSAPLLISESSVKQQPLRSVFLRSTSEQVLKTTHSHHNGAVGNLINEKSGMFGLGLQMNPESEHLGMSSRITASPSVLAPVMTAQRFSAPLAIRNGVPILDNVPGQLFPDERGSAMFGNSRIVSLYDDGRLPFHEYEHPQGDKAIRIRHVWNTRSLSCPRRMPQHGNFRDWMNQRSGSFGRNCLVDIRDRSRSPLNGSNAASAVCVNTGVADGSSATNLPSTNNNGGNSVVTVANSEPGSTKYDRA